jgi:hypothetical protein
VPFLLNPIPPSDGGIRVQADLREPRGVEVGLLGQSVPGYGAGGDSAQAGGLVDDLHRDAEDLFAQEELVTVLEFDLIANPAVDPVTAPQIL